MATVLLEFYKPDGTIDPIWGYARVTSVAVRSLEKREPELYLRVVFDRYLCGKRPLTRPSWLAARYLYKPSDVTGQWKVRTR